MKKTIATNNAPAAIGPYSQAVQAGNLLFLSGQIPLDPETGQMIGDTAAAQTTQVMANLSAVLSAAGSSLSSLVKTTIFLQNLDDFAGVNEVYGSYFSEAPPARATVEGSRLPKGALVEIEGVAIVKS